MKTGEQQKAERGIPPLRDFSQIILYYVNKFCKSNTEVLPVFLRFCCCSVL